MNFEEKNTQQTGDIVTHKNFPRKKLAIVVSIVLGLILLLPFLKFLSDFILDPLFGRAFWNFVGSLPSGVAEILKTVILFGSIIFIWIITSILCFKIIKKISSIKNGLIKILVTILIIILLGLFFYPKAIRGQFAECYGIPTKISGHQATNCYGVIIGNNRTLSIPNF